MRLRISALIALIMLVFNIRVYADYMPSIAGETRFNRDVEEIVSGEKTLSPLSVLDAVREDITREVRESAGDIIMIIILAAISGAVTLLAEHGMKEGSEAAFFCCFTAMSMCALHCFSVALKYGQTVISAMSAFVTKLSPLLMLMLAASGRGASAAAFRPVLSAAVYITTALTEKLLLPLCVFGAVLSVSGNIGGENRISGLCRTVGSVNKWIMSAVVTIFTGISAIYGFNAPALDTLTAKTMKFAAGTLVPVVGGFLSDTLETVVSGSRLMKNAVGTAGVIAVCSMCLVPVVKVGVIHLMLRLASALSEPVADKRISAMLADCASAVGGIFAAVVMTAVLFVLNICVMTAATN